MNHSDHTTITKDHMPHAHFRVVGGHSDPERCVQVNQLVQVTGQLSN